jgi:IS1 family transposase
LASGKDSKLIVSYITGKREYGSGKDLVGDLRSRVAQRFQVTSDAWTGFVRGVIDHNIDNKIDYAVQIKKYDGYNSEFKGPRRYFSGKCVSVKTHHICGSPEYAKASTSHAERLNLSLRHFKKRFTRLSPCFSKKLENLALSVALTVAYFNFCRPHASLKIKTTETTKNVERTPAMAAGLTEHVWMVEELLAVL